MPQGVTNAPSTFQRLMEKCMGELNLKEVLVFIDDLIVFAPTLEEHEERLMKVLNRLKEYGLKLSVEKCMFFQTSVKYLGHVVSQEGVQTDPDKIKTLTTWPVPTNLKELRSFLGFSGYYRRFIEGYSAITKPLHDLTAGYPPAQKRFAGKPSVPIAKSPVSSTIPAPFQTCVPEIPHGPEADESVEDSGEPVDDVMAAGTEDDTPSDFEESDDADDSPTMAVTDVFMSLP
uniref:ribonuclease H n=1 Tax=Knipowitschia caucasica TaxID=637954 RepID=A0AAV2JYQ4_KNICA